MRGIPKIGDKDEIDTLLFVLVNPEVVINKVASSKIFNKLFVVSDDYKLKVSLELSGSNDSGFKRPRHRCE